MERSLPQTALPWRVLGAWADLRGSMRTELDRAPSEGRLLFYLVLSQIVWLIGKLMELSFGPLAPIYTSDDLAREASGHVASLFFRMLLMYGLAALGHGVSRAFGGTGSWRDSRAALFWAALVAAPAILAATLLSMLVTGLSWQAGSIASMLGAVALAWALAHCLAEAHGFAGAWRVLAAVAVLAGLVVALAHLLVTTNLPAQAGATAGFAGATVRA
jgi:hypothetical protein